MRNICIDFCGFLSYIIHFRIKRIAVKRKVEEVFNRCLVNGSSR